MCDGGKGNHPTGSRLVLGDGCALQSCCAPGLPSTCLRPVVPRHPDTPSPHRGVSLIKSLLLDTPARVGAPSPLSLGGCGRQRAPSVLPVPPPPGEDTLGSCSGSWHPGGSLGAAPPLSPLSLGSRRGTWRSTISREFTARQPARLSCLARQEEALLRQRAALRVGPGMAAATINWNV